MTALHIAVPSQRKLNGHVRYKIELRRGGHVLNGHCEKRRSEVEALKHEVKKVLGERYYHEYFGEGAFPSRWAQDIAEKLEQWLKSLVTLVNSSQRSVSRNIQQLLELILNFLCMTSDAWFLPAPSPSPAAVVVQCEVMPASPGRPVPASPVAALATRQREASAAALDAAAQRDIAASPPSRSLDNMSEGRLLLGAAAQDLACSPAATLPPSATAPASTTPPDHHRTPPTTVSPILSPAAATDAAAPTFRALRPAKMMPRFLLTTVTLAIYTGVLAVFFRVCVLPGLDLALPVGWPLGLWPTIALWVFSLVFLRFRYLAEPGAKTTRKSMLNEIWYRSAR